MMVLRSALFMAWSILLTVITGIPIVIAALIRGVWGYHLVYVWRRIFMWGVEHILGIKSEFRGLENLPKEPCVILAKHQSAWETVALQDLAPPGGYCLFVLKKELLKIPFFGWSLAAMRMISIDRASGQKALEQVVEQGRDRLQRGYSVIIFPEGTRVAPGEKRRYKPGGAYLATHVGCLVVPVAHNAGELWPRQAFLKKPGKITVSIGPAFSAEGLSEQEVNKRVEDWIEGEMRKLSPHRYRDAAGKAQGQAETAEA
ncbi:MAG TPA: lysophospholipid acyltransferase family protein [Rhodocyclaceae bacterium]|nr:lysophospholipid acyltransferase family protein [Rhodocyclaceae bacterium]